jgi:hypothetical protein
MKSKSEFDAKRYVQLFMAGYVPRSKDEKKFVDKHVAQLHQDVNGNKDDVFNATNIPTHKRPPYHGYEKGHDEKVYESVEQIDEWNKHTLSSYIIKATSDLRRGSFEDGMQAHRDLEPNNDVFQRKQEKRGKRQIGIGRAALRLAYRKVSEDAQQIDEASLTAGTQLISKHEGADGHHAEVRYSKEWDDYQVHHYLNGKHLGEGPVSYHYDDKKDAEAVARYTTSIRNHDYTDGNSPTKRTYGKDPVSECVEQIDEVSKKEHEYNMDAAQREMDRREAQGEDMTGAKIHPKTYEIIKPKKALKEEMSDAQMAKRERIVKSMKKKSATFEKRYGDKAQDVMYATATKMAMEDLDYVNLEMTDAVADLLEAEVATPADDKSKVKSLKQMEDQAKKVRDVVKKFPIAPRVESASVIEQLLSQIEEETIVLEFNNGETIEIVGALAESILNIFMELSEDNQAQFEELISESMADFEDALSFIAEAYEGNE